MMKATVPRISPVKTKVGRDDVDHFPSCLIFLLYYR